MRFGPVPLDRAVGQILGHNIARPDGQRAFRKGRRLTTGDIETLRDLGHTTVYVAGPGEHDLDENTAARRVAEAVKGENLRLSGAASGRVNLLAITLGVLCVDVKRLNRINAHHGITLATLPSHSILQPRKMAATVKIIPFAIPQTAVQRVESMAASGGPILSLRPLQRRRVGLILSGPQAMRERLVADFAPLGERVEALGSQIVQSEFVSPEDGDMESALASALARQRQTGIHLIILAGETAIMDRNDIAPRAIRRAGGKVECVGAPVDPGNLLMLAYFDQVPVLGAPGCARSRKINVIDWILPRLLVGERLSRSEVSKMGHGGLLEDVPERPMPRSRR